MKSTELFKLTWEWAGIGAATFGGKKSDYFKAAFDMVNEMRKEGKDAEDIRDEMDPGRVIVKAKDLPIIRYDNFRIGTNLYKYTEGGGHYSFWYINHGTGSAAGSDDIDLAGYKDFHDSDIYTVEDFLTDPNVLAIIRDHLNDQSIKYVELLKAYVYGDRFDNLKNVDWSTYAEPDEEELEAMHEYDDEQKLKRAMKEAQELFGDDFYE